MSFYITMYQLSWQCDRSFWNSSCFLKPHPLDNVLGTMLHLSSWFKNRQKEVEYEALSPLLFFLIQDTLYCKVAIFNWNIWAAEIDCYFCLFRWKCMLKDALLQEWHNPIETCFKNSWWRNSSYNGSHLSSRVWSNKTVVFSRQHFLSYYEANVLKIRFIFLVVISFSEIASIS